MERKSLEQWHARTRTVDLGDGWVVEMKSYDLTELVDQNGNTPNPLLKVVQEAIAQFQASQSETRAVDAATHVLDSVPEIRARLNQVLVDIIAYPPILEAGHENGVSISHFTIDEKVKMYGALMGGWEANARATSFLKGQGSSVVAIPTGE